MGDALGVGAEIVEGNVRKDRVHFPAGGIGEG
jgi:hypothetical protein